MHRLTRDDCLRIRQYTAEVLAARKEYYAHPTVAAEEDWCVACCWPRSDRKCAVCRAHSTMRESREEAMRP